MEHAVSCHWDINSLHENVSIKRRENSCSWILTARVFRFWIYAASNVGFPVVSWNVEKYLTYFQGRQLRTPSIPRDLFPEANKNSVAFSPYANYTDRATAACRRSYCQFLLIEGVAWSAQQKAGCLGLFCIYNNFFPTIKKHSHGR
jgi:hypothetical protein